MMTTRTIPRPRRAQFMLPLVALAFFSLPVAVLFASPPGQLISKQEAEVVKLVNAERAKVGRKPLAVNYSLQDAAWKHNDLMTKTGCFAHTCPGEPDPFKRISATGYKYVTAGENIAKGQRTPAEVMDAWMHSTGHKANILNKDYTDIGVAYSKSGPTWTQDFGTPIQGYATVTPPGGARPGACYLPADLNGDSKVTNADVDAVSRRFMQTKTSPGWDERFDLVPDGVIDVKDIFEAMLAVGTTC